MTTAQILNSGQLQNQNEILLAENLDLRNVVTHLTQQLDWFKRQIFGKKSERIISDLNTEQLLLEGFDAKDLQAQEKTQDVPAHQRRKPNRNGQDAITWCPCWSHIRRKFFDAESGDLPFRNWVLRKIRYLFMLEKVAWARTPEERLRIRQEKEVPIIDELIQKIKARLTNGNLLPKSKFREALGYFCGLIPYLKSYTNHAFARLDNNVAERAVRPLAIGRKNWLFFGSEDGGEAAAILLSLVQTCRGLKINPREYLEDVFRRLMGHSAQKLEELLPDRWLAAHQQSQKSKT